MKDLSGYIDSILDLIKLNEYGKRRVYLKEGTYIIEYTFYTTLHDTGTDDFLTQIVKEQVDKVIDQYIPKGSLEYLIFANIEPLHKKR